MIYKTVMLQLYRPSKRKRALIDRALLRYSQALQALLDGYRDDIEALSRSETRVTPRLLLGLIGRETSNSLNAFGIQPFKDSLKMEFAALAALSVGQKRSARGAGYPFVFLDASRYASAVSGCIDRFDRGETSYGKFGEECAKLISRAGRPHSLYFGRYSANRDYCLLYDEFKDRFYAKLYLLNYADSYSSESATSSLSLRYVAAGMPPLVNEAGKKRYIVVPLAFGKRQYEDLKKALADPTLLHTARLVKRSGRYYLMVNLACGSGPALEAATTMGVSRDPFGGLSYTVCGREGAILKRDRIFSPDCRDQAIYTFSNTIVGIALENRSQVILESNGGTNDRVPVFRGGAAPLSGRQYALLSRLLNYKLPEKRLPPPIEVSANGLFVTCPNCQNRTSRNSVSDGLFACIECGYASESEWIGSENLAGRLIRYRQDQVPITVLRKENSLLFCNRLLGFEYSLPQNAADYGPMYDELSRYVQSLEGRFQSDSRKYAVWKKLRQASDIREAVRLLIK